MAMTARRWTLSALKLPSTLPAWWPVQAGLPGAAALLLLAGAAGLAGVATPAWQAEAQAQQAQARQVAQQQARHAAQRQQAQAEDLAASAAAQGSATLAASPMAERVADLLALALRHGVQVQRLAQKPVAQAGVDSVQLVFNAQGTYADLRRLAEAALLQDPALSLDRLALRRTTASDAVLDAELQWSLWRAAPARGAARVAANAPWPQPPSAVQAAWGLSPPPPPPVATAAPAPTAAPMPKFPYTWIGRLEEGARDGVKEGSPQGQTTALLAGPQRSVGVRAGDVLDGQWRVDRIAPAALHLTWLPTGQTLNLSTR